VPDDYTTMMRRFIEDLIVPETHWTIDQLRRRNYKSRMPQKIVKTGSYAPGTERMKKYLPGIR
jgi:hypothetical protein